MRWIVDAMNVIGTRPDGWWRDRDAAMARLVDLLERYVADTGEDVLVVFERRPNPVIRSTVIEIAHATKRGPDAADFEIVRRVEADPSPRAIQVVTSDRWLGDRVSALGATVFSSEAFRNRID
ncbi:MAG: NYN domain-containing protein [Thermoleophilaceae bacterium]